MTGEGVKLTKSKERVRKHGEVFTPAWVVNDMLDMLPDDVWKVEKTFLEPACGEGAFLIEIFRRKLTRLKDLEQKEWEWQAAIAAGSMYGIELLADNTAQCRVNLMNIFMDFYVKLYPETQDEGVIKVIAFIFDTNIIQGNTLTHKRADGNDIVFSEWTPIDASRQFKRKDFSLAGMIEGNKQKEANKGTFFEENEEDDNIGLVKGFEPVYWKDIIHVADGKH